MTMNDRAGRAEDLRLPDQRRYFVVVEQEGLTLGPRVRRKGERFYASDLDAETFSMVEEGLIPGASLEPTSVNPAPVTVPDVCMGFRPDGSPIMIPGDRRANVGLMFSVHGTTQQNAVAAHEARTVGEEVLEQMLQEEGLNTETGLHPFGAVELASRHAAQGYESVRATAEQDEYNEWHRQQHESGEDHIHATGMTQEPSGFGFTSPEGGSAAQPVASDPNTANAGRTNVQEEGQPAQRRARKAKVEGLGSQGANPGEIDAREGQESE